MNMICKTTVTEINTLVANKCCSQKCYFKHLFCIKDVYDAIKLLRNNKTDGSNQWSNSIINGCHRLFVYLSILFNLMLKHTFSPKDLLVSTIVPIQKNKKKSLNDSNNYRGIALSSIIGKVLELLILNSNREILKSCDLQFGFKPKHSTTQCTFVLNEVIKYFNNKNSDVFVMMLDASKAFDRVHYVSLFKIMLHKGLCPLICSLLACMYLMQSVRIKWGHYISNVVTVTNGVKQGSILSPILFTLYMDEMFLKLKKSGLGCHIGDTHMGSLGYADDDILLSPTLFAMKKMLKICDDFGIKYNVMFNADKYQFLHFPINKSQTIQGISHNGVYIKCVPYSKHLGHIVGASNTTRVMDEAISSFNVSLNSILNTFGNVYIPVKYKLFKTYCMSLYGCVLWDFDCTQMNRFYVSWRKALRRLYNLSNRTHNRYIHLICKDTPVKAVIQTV